MLDRSTSRRAWASLPPARPPANTTHGEELTAERLLLHDASNLLHVLFHPSAPPRVRDLISSQAMLEAARIESYLLGGRDDRQMSSLHEVVSSYVVGFPDLTVSLSLAARRVTLPIHQARAVGRAVSAALHNIRLHAGTSIAAVEVAGSPRKWTVTVRDQGVGFDPRRTDPGFGVRTQILANVAAAGLVGSVDSDIERGTTVVIATQPGGRSLWRSTRVLSCLTGAVAALAVAVPRLRAEGLMTTGVLGMTFAGYAGGLGMSRRIRVVQAVPRRPIPITQQTSLTIHLRALLRTSVELLTLVGEGRADENAVRARYPEVERHLIRIRNALEAPDRSQDRPDGRASLAGLLRLCLRRFDDLGVDLLVDLVEETVVPGALVGPLAEVVEAFLRRVRDCGGTSLVVHASPEAPGWECTLRTGPTTLPLDGERLDLAPPVLAALRSERMEIEISVDGPSLVLRAAWGAGPATVATPENPGYADTTILETLNR